MKNFTFLFVLIFLTGFGITAEASKSLNGNQPENPEEGKAVPTHQTELIELMAEKPLVLSSQTDLTLEQEIPAVFSDATSFSVVTEKIEHREPNLNLGLPGTRSVSSDSQALRRKKTNKRLIVGAVLNAALVTVVTSMMNSSGNQVKVGAAGI